jgi:hypothetical protein
MESFWSDAWNILKLITIGLAGTISFGANLVTLILGAVGVWALCFRRQQLGKILNAIEALFLNQRIQRIRVTLAVLERLDWDDKLERNEIRSAFGTICGQLAPFADDHDSARGLHTRAEELLDGRMKFSEWQKQRFVAEVHDLLDKTIFGHHKKEATDGR